MLSETYVEMNYQILKYSCVEEAFLGINIVKSGGVKALKSQQVFCCWRPVRDL